MNPYLYPSAFTMLLATVFICGCASRDLAGMENQQGNPKGDSPELVKLRTEAYGHVLRGEYDRAIPLYERTIALARASGNEELSIQFMNNLAGCFHAKYAYRDAMHHYLEALKHAKGIGLRQQQSLASLNLATLYLDSGEKKAARELVAGISLESRNFVSTTRLDSYLQLVNIYTRLEDDDGIETAFRYALNEANREPPAALSISFKATLAKWPESLRELRRAWAFATMSQALTRRNKLQLAKEYSFEAFRIRSIFGEKARLRDALQLAMLLRNSNDLDSAARLLKVARGLDPSNTTPMHLFLLDREEARIAIARGEFAAALGPLRSALSRARSWRMEVLPTDSAFLNFESYLTGEVHASFLDTLSKNGFPLDQPGVAEETFWVAEEARFASMRASQFPAAEFTNRLPQRYWTTLSEFHKLQAEVSSNKPATITRLDSLEQQLNELELEAGLSIPHAGGKSAPAFADWQKTLPAGEAVFSYYLSEPTSLAWVVTDKTIAVRRIAGKAELTAWVEQYRREIADPSQNGISSTGMKLSKQLFGEYLYVFRTIPFWTMVLDQQLANLPITALAADEKGTRYLVEDHNLRVIPSAIFLGKGEEHSWTGRAVGIGDPVYNNADARVSPGLKAALSAFQLNRLPGSARELFQSLEVFRAEGWSAIAVTGMNANATMIRKTLADSPDILHFSTHFVATPGIPEQISIALSPLANQPGQSLLSSLDLNSVRTNTKLVVLSGCSSSSGEVVPGIAINGLSRAFLISGASTVISTLWPTLDSDGPLFPVLYSQLIQRKWSPRAAAEALRAAQIKMIRQGGWTAKPAYWAAYLAISKG